MQGLQGRECGRKGTEDPGGHHGHSTSGSQAREGPAEPSRRSSQQGGRRARRLSVEEGLNLPNATDKAGKMQSGGDDWI